MHSGSRAPGVFIIFFVLFVALNSSGWASVQVQAFAGDVPRWCLVAAIAALGMKTSLKSLFEVGWRPATLLISETLFLALPILFAVKALA